MLIRYRPRRGLEQVNPVQHRGRLVARNCIRVRCGPNGQQVQDVESDLISFGPLDCGPGGVDAAAQLHQISGMH